MIDDFIIQHIFNLQMSTHYLMRIQKFYLIF
jgi:hypothetical protein